MVEEEIVLHAMQGYLAIHLTGRIKATNGRLETQERLPVVQGDFGLVWHVLQYLIGNGLKYAGDGVPPLVTLSCQVADGNKVICVEDNGIGFDEKYSTRIFLPFERLAESKSQKDSGLGLSIRKKIVEAYGGEIWIESSQGVGTRFYFHLGN